MCILYLQAFSTTTYTTWCPLTVTSRSVLLPLHYKFCMDCTRTACTRSIHVYVCYVLAYVVVASHVVYRYTLDILWGQPIKLIQVVSTSEFHEY